MAKDNLKALFQLPADEEIFDDFMCKEGFSGKGRLYLTSGHLCFFSSLLGITKKLVISWESITRLEKEKKEGIRIHRANNESAVLFTNFQSRDTSLKFIKRLWARNSSHAGIGDESDDDDDEDDEADKLLAQAATSSTKSNGEAPRHNSEIQQSKQQSNPMSNSGRQETKVSSLQNSFADPMSPALVNNKQSQLVQMNDSQKTNNTAPVTNDFQQLRESTDTDQLDPVPASLYESVERRKSSDFRARVQLGIKDEEYMRKRNQKINIVQSPPAASEANPGTTQEESKEPVSAAAAAEKKPKEDPDYTTQAELDAFEQSVKIGEPYLQLLSLQVGLSCQDYFEAFHGDSATYPLDKFYQSKGAKINQTTPWKDPSVEEKDFNGMKVSKVRTIDAEFKVDSAFVKAAPTLKTFRIVEHTSTTIKILSLNRTRDIPYCDTFDVEDILLVRSLRPNSKCCVVQIGLTMTWHKTSMMKSMIKSNTEREARAMNNDLAQVIKQFPFVEQKKPQPKATPGEPIPVDDYTPEKALKALMAKAATLQDFNVIQEMCVGLSAIQFWERFFKDEAEEGFGKFMVEKGNKDVAMSTWEEAKGGEESILMGHKAKRMRKLDFVAIIKNNPMVSQAPTTKTYYLIEQSETKLHILCRNNTREVPYCDTFQVLEEYIFLSPEPSSQPVIKSGVLRLSYHLHWLKSTLMKSLIRSNVDSETKANLSAYLDTRIKQKQLTFVEKKAPVVAKKGRSLKVESSLHLQKVADRERKKAQKEEEAKKEEERRKAKELEAKRHDAEDWFEYLKLFAVDIGTAVTQYAQKEPTNFLLILIFFMLFYVNWRLGSLQNQVYSLQESQAELIEIRDILQQFLRQQADRNPN